MNDAVETVPPVRTMIPHGLRRAIRNLMYRVPREADVCPACSSGALHDLAYRELGGAVDGRRVGLISGCETCGLVFVNPLPSDDELAAFYAPTGRWARAREGVVRPASPRALRPEAAAWVRRFASVREYLDVTHPPPGARVLDFGCGDGKLLDALQDCGWETTGIDTAVDVAFARHARLTTVPDEPVFDLVILNHVLEHVTKPVALLRALARASQPGAVLFLSVPSLDRLPVHGDFKYVLNGQVHVTAYTADCLAHLMARAGWEPLAPPADQPVGKSRMLGRLSGKDVVLPRAPLRAAQAALRQYGSAAGDESQFQSPVRWSARRADARLWQEVRARKAAARASKGR